MTYFGLESKWIETAPGETTHYHDLGEGTPVLFLHGSGAGVSAAANWWLNLPNLSESMRTIAIDLTGFGQTKDPLDNPFGIKAWVEHCIRFLDALGIEKTWLVGNSLGGWVAFQLALDHPERIAGVISMGTGGAQRTNALKSHARPELSVEGIRQALLDFVVDPNLVQDELVEARFLAATGEGANERFQRVIKARDADREGLPLDLDELAQLEMPVLLIHGRNDRVIPLSRSLSLAEAIPSADLHVFSNCGHWSQVERAKDFDVIVGGYIRARS